MNILTQIILILFFGAIAMIGNDINHEYFIQATTTQILGQLMTINGMLCVGYIAGRRD